MSRTRDLVRFLLLTPLQAQRRRGLVWSEVDLDRGWIRIAAPRMKNGEAHELPLSKQALAILAARKPASAKPDALVFPSGEGKPYDGWTRLLARIRKALGQGDAERDNRFSVHDIRGRSRRISPRGSTKTSRPDARASPRVAIRLGRRLPEGEAAE